MIVGIPSTIADLNGLYPNIYGDALFVARDNSLMAGLVSQLSGSTFATRYIPIYNQLTASTVSEGATATAQQLTKGTAETIVPAIVTVRAALTDERIMTDPDNAGDAIAREAGMAIGQKVDQDLIGEFANFSQDFGAAGSALTIKRAAAAVAYIRAQSAFDRPNAVVAPYTWYSLQTELSQAGVTTRSGNGVDIVNQAMRDFWVSDFQGANWYTSANIGTGTAAVSGMFAREAIVLDTRTSMTMEIQRDADTRSWWYYFVMRYGTGTPRPTFGVKLTATNSVPTSF